MLGGSFDELIDVYHAIAVSVGQVHQLGDDVVSNVPTEALEEIGELILRDDTIIVLIEHSEDLSELIFSNCTLRARSIGDWEV